MDRTNANAFTNDIARELDEIRRLAAQVRDLQDMELGWVSGGDGTPGWDGTPPPGP